MNRSYSAVAVVHASVERSCLRICMYMYSSKGVISGEGSTL